MFIKYEEGQSIAVRHIISMTVVESKVNPGLYRLIAWLGEAYIICLGTHEECLKVHDYILGATGGIDLTKELWRL